MSFVGLAKSEASCQHDIVELKNQRNLFENRLEGLEQLISELKNTVEVLISRVSNDINLLFYTFVSFHIYIPENSI